MGRAKGGGGSLGGTHHLGSARVARIIIPTPALPSAVSVRGYWETMCQHALILTLRCTTSREHPHVFGPCEVGVGACDREDVVPEFLMVGRKYDNVLIRICGLCAARDGFELRGLDRFSRVGGYKLVHTSAYRERERERDTTHPSYREGWQNCSVLWTKARVARSEENEGGVASVLVVCEESSSPAVSE